MSTLTIGRGRWSLSWENEDDGDNGFYDSENPEDVRRLRVNLYRLSTELEYVEIFSYWTPIPVGVDVDLIGQLSNQLLDVIEDIPVYRVRAPFMDWLDRIKGEVNVGTK